MTKSSLANKTLTNIIGVGTKQGVHVASKTMISSHLHTAQTLHETRSLSHSRLSKASGQPNPSISDAASRPK